MIINLDTDVLRTFVAGMELGSFAKAAERLGRSTSAVSAQLRKIEQQAGTPVFRKSGRGLALTDAGERLLSYARRLLDLNDEAVGALRHVDLEGLVRLGLQEDFGETILPSVLGRFSRSHPRVRIEAHIARNAELMAGIESDRLDLALAWQVRQVGTTRALAELPMIWVGASDREDTLPVGKPLPLAALEAPCVLRSAACDALDRAGLAWRMAFVSPSLAGFWAAIAAGLGVGVRTPAGLPPSVRQIESAPSGLPALPSLKLALYVAASRPTPVTTELGDLIADAVRQSLPQYGLAY